MAIEKFKPIIWAKNIEEGLKRDSVFYEDTNHAYEGIAKQPGDTIKIKGLGEPTLRMFSDGKLHKLDDPEKIEDLSMVIPLNHVADYHFFVDDLDKAQTEGSTLDRYTERAKYKIMNEEDKFMANFALDKSVQQITSADTLTSDKNFLKMIDNAYATLMEQDVPSTKEVVLTLSWRYLQVLRAQYQDLDTNNHEMLKNGKVGMYHNIIIKVSNNIATNRISSTDYEYFQLRTRDAVSFVRPYIHMEAYRPDDYFADAVKGYSLFDGAVTSPKEIVALKVPKISV